MSARRRIALASAPGPLSRLTRIALAAVLLAAPRPSIEAQQLPARLSDSTFWRLVDDLSEPGGFFHSDNFVSNESAFQYVIPALLESTPQGGVYLGVGPDQNFTYLVALRPKIAFIIDIRRQNMLQHLMYKALIELSPSRADFLSRLLSRPRPPGVDTASTADALFQSFGTVAPDSLLFRRNLAALKEKLVTGHGFALNVDDMRAIEYVYSAFHTAGPDLTYSYPQVNRGFGGRGMPTYGQLMIESDAEGQRRSYLASEANYRVLRQLQLDNLIVPLVGDFAGPKTVRAVGDYLRERGATVSVFYTSNVEQYLFQQIDGWSKFYESVATLPMDSTSTFIRSIANRGWVQNPHPTARSASVRSSMKELVRAFNEGALRTYQDLMMISK